MEASGSDRQASVSDLEASAIVLCGGTSRRMGGVDKTAQPLGGSTVLDHLLASLPPAWPVVCVGARRPTVRPVTWTRESPPAGGPVAGMASGLLALTAARQAHPRRRAGRSGQARPAGQGVVPEDGNSPSAPFMVAVLAGDMPFAGPASVELVRRLRDLPAEVDAVLGSDGEGRTQPLLAAYRGLALAVALPPEPAGAAMMAMVSALRTHIVPVDARAALDVDTPRALALARHMVGS